LIYVAREIDDVAQVIEERRLLVRTEVVSVLRHQSSNEVLLSAPEVAGVANCVKHQASIADSRHIRRRKQLREIKPVRRRTIGGRQRLKWVMWQFEGCHARCLHGKSD